MNYTLTFCVLFSLLFAHGGYSSELRSEKSGMMMLSSGDMDHNLFEGIIDRVSGIAANQQLINQYTSISLEKKQPLDDKAIRLLMKNIELILDLEDLVDKNQHKMPVESKTAVTNFTKSIKNHYVKKMCNHKK